MSDNTIPFPQGNRTKNVKADMFEKYMKDEGLNFFRRQETHDSYDTIVFMTAIPAGKHHKLVAAVITDNSMYTLLRIHLGTAPKGPARKTFLAFLNDLNAHHAIVKYSIGSDENVFLDVTFTTRPENFDPATIRTTMDIVVYQLSQTYDDIARRLLFGDGGPADEYLLLADFESYRDAHQRAGLAYQDPKRWNQMALMNIARSGIFAADRSIRDYARDIWNVPVRTLK